MLILFIYIILNNKNQNINRNSLKNSQQPDKDDQTQVERYENSEHSICLVHFHISASNFSILAYRFSFYMLISKNN